MQIFFCNILTCTNNNIWQKIQASLTILQVLDIFDSHCVKEVLVSKQIRCFTFSANFKYTIDIVVIKQTTEHRITFEQSIQRVIPHYITKFNYVLNPYSTQIITQLVKNPLLGIKHQTLAL